MNQHRIQIFPTGRMDGRSYLIVCPHTGQAVIVDPDVNDAALLAAVAQQELAVQYVLLTHCHFDHMSSADRVRAATGAQTLIHRLDAPGLADPRLNMSVMDTERIHGRQVDRMLEDGDRLLLGEVPVEVLLTPGHSPGSVCYRVGDDLLTGDTLFRGSYGNPNFPGGHLPTLRQSCLALFALPDEVRVYPGHGEPTTIGQEKRSNPILL